MRVEREHIRSRAKTLAKEDGPTRKEVALFWDRPRVVHHRVHFRIRRYSVVFSARMAGCNASIFGHGFPGRPCKVDARLPGKGNSTSHGARPVHQIISMIKWIWTSKLSIKHSLPGRQTGRQAGEADSFSPTR